MAKRYDQMFALIDQIKPQVVIEVGVHRGVRSAKLCSRALRHQSRVSYHGYDVFDTVPEIYQEEALNGKGPPSKEDAEARLHGCGRGLNFSFTVGDTRKTLHGRHIVGDFAFIDGDHRIDAIEGDYKALSGSRCVVFDDYYRPGPNGYTPDLALYGANAVVDRLAERGRHVEILPIGDVCKHSGVSHLAVVWL